MGCLSSARVAEIEAEITELTTRLTALNSAYSDAIAGGIESYKLDSAESSSAVKYKSLDSMEKAIDKTSSRIKHLKAKLRGTGLVNLNLRRK